MMSPSLISSNYNDIANVNSLTACPMSHTLSMCIRYVMVLQWWPGVMDHLTCLDPTTLHNIVSM